MLGLDWRLHQALGQNRDHALCGRAVPQQQAIPLLGRATGHFGALEARHLLRPLILEDAFDRERFVSRLLARLHVAQNVLCLGLVGLHQLQLHIQAVVQVVEGVGARLVRCQVENSSIDK